MNDLGGQTIETEAWGRWGLAWILASRQPSPETLTNRKSTRNRHTQTATSYIPVQSYPKLEHINKNEIDMALGISLGILQHGTLANSLHAIRGTELWEPIKQ